LQNFSIENLAIGLGNSAPGRRISIAEAHLVYGYARHRLFLLPSGEVVIPITVTPAELRGRIAVECRRRVLTHFTTVFAVHDAAGGA